MKIIGTIFFIMLFFSNPICAQSNEPILKFGHITGENPTIIFKKYKSIVNIISKEIGIEVTLVQTTSYSKMQEAFLNKEIDMGILNAFSYINVAYKAELTPLVRRVMYNNNRGTYQSYIIVHRDGNIKEYRDIKGKIFAFQDPYSTSSYLLPRIMLMNNGIDPDRDLKKTLFISTHDSIIYAVLNWTADAGAVASYIFEQADTKLKEKIRVLYKSDPVPLGPMVIRKDLGEELADKIKKIMLDLDQSKEGKIALQYAKLSRFEDAKDSDYDILREMADLLIKK